VSPGHDRVGRFQSLVTPSTSHEGQALLEEAVGRPGDFSLGNQIKGEGAVRGHSESTEHKGASGIVLLDVCGEGETTVDRGYRPAMSSLPNGKGSEGIRIAEKNAQLAPERFLDRPRK